MMKKYASPLQDPCTFQWNNPRQMTDAEIKAEEEETGFCIPRLGSEKDWVGKRVSECLDRGLPFDTSDLTREYRRLKAEGKL